MTDLERICENALYDEIRVLDDGKSVVRDIPTGKLYFKKTLDVYNEFVFEYLRSHKNRHVAAVQAYWKEGDKLVVIEELIQGRTLEELLEEEGEDKLSFDARIDILSQICDGLQFLHSADPPIIHRDIKASNIMVTDDGIVKIIDYDAAKIYITGQKKDTVMIGTQGLAAPEQYGFAQSDVRTDLYAFGKLIESMLPDNIDAKRIADKATEMDPKKRYISASQMKAHILRIREKPSFLVKKLEKIPGFDPMDRSDRAKAGAALAAVVLAAVLLVAVWSWRSLVYPAKVTEQITAEMAAISDLDTSEGGIPDAVQEFVSTYPYQKMNAAQKKEVRDGMEQAMERCCLDGKTEEAQKIRDILMLHYGEEELWESVYSYALAECKLESHNFEEGLAILHRCREDGAEDAEEHWEDGVRKVQETARESLSAFKENTSDIDLQLAVDAHKALQSYDAEEEGEFDEAYQEILAVAAQKREVEAWEMALNIYGILQEAGIGDSSELEELMNGTRYERAGAAFAEESYGEAAQEYLKLGDYMDAAEQYKESMYLQGMADQESEKYDLAAASFESIIGYKDAEDRCLESKLRYCEQTAEEPTDTTYAFFESLTDSGYGVPEELQDEIYKWHVIIQTGMAYSFGPLQSAYINVTLNGGPPDAVTTITLRIDDPTRGEYDIWSDGKEYSAGDTVEVSYSEEDSSYSLFDRSYKVQVYADQEVLIGTWEGQFSTENGGE